MKTDILIISPTRMEITPLLKLAQNQSEIINKSGRVLIDAMYMQKKFKILITEPGIVNTAQALTEEIIQNRPAIVIQTGIAGIFKNTGLKIGDIAVAESEQYIHAGIETCVPYRNFNLDPLPFDLISGSSPTRKGIFPVDLGRSHLCFKILQNYFAMKKIQVGRGLFITVSTITGSDSTAEDLFSIFSPCMEAMEGAAAAHVAALYKIPFIEIRAGSNYVGQRNKSKWNIPLAAERASLAVAALIKRAPEIVSES